MDLIKSGITGLDSLLHGGIPQGNQVILAGGPGTGKTLMSFEFAFHNAMSGKKVIYFSLEETTDKIIESFSLAMPDFADDAKKLIADKRFIMSGRETALMIRNGTKEDTYQIDNLISRLSSIIANEKAEFVVIDSLSVFSLLTNDSPIYKRSMYLLTETLQRLNATTILTAELSERDITNLKFKSEFFIFDGIIVLYQLIANKRRMSEIEVIKMRRNSHSFEIVPYLITSKGIKIFIKDSNIY